jgi:hypothetical protein
MINRIDLAALDIVLLILTLDKISGDIKEAIIQNLIDSCSLN